MWICAVILQKRTVEVLDQQVPYYNWTGFYWMNDVKSQLELGAYVGAATDHTSIPTDGASAVKWRSQEQPLKFLMYMLKIITWPAV